jgi:hypothetical protein
MFMKARCRYHLHYGNFPNSHDGPLALPGDMPPFKSAFTEHIVATIAVQAGVAQEQEYQRQHGVHSQAIVADCERRFQYQKQTGFLPPAGVGHVTGT